MLGSTCLVVILCLFHFLTPDRLEWLTVVTRCTFAGSIQYGEQGCHEKLWPQTPENLRPSLRAGSLVWKGSRNRELARRMGRFTHTFPRFAGSRYPNKWACSQAISDPSILFENDLSNSSRFLSPEIIYGHAIFIDNSHPERSQTFIFSGLSLSKRSNSEKLTRFKIVANTFMTFAGDFFFFTGKNSKTESL